MITKCPNCGAMLECNQDPGSPADCAGCGISFPAYPAEPPVRPIQQKDNRPTIHVPLHIQYATWEDDGRMALLINAGWITSVSLFAFGFKQLAIFATGLVIWSVTWWVCQCIRACAHRLKHIEELLARRP